MLDLLKTELIDMFDDKSGDLIENIFDNCWGSEVERHVLQCEGLECRADSESVKMEMHDNKDNTEDIWFFDVSLNQEIELEKQGHERNPRKTKKHNPFYVPSKVVREMVSRSSVECWR